MTPERHKVDLKIKLHRDGLTQTMFFNSIVSAYINDDPLFHKWFSNERHSMGTSKSRQAVLTREEAAALGNMRKFGFDDREIESIFDLIAKERE